MIAIKIQRLSLILFAAIILLYSQNAFAWTGKVIGVSDGDSIKVLFQGREVKVRLYGIDCPENGQAFGNKAKKMTNALLRGRNVRVYSEGKDRYGRTLAVVVADGTNVNEALIRNGYAWVYRKYCKEKYCSKWYQHETYAKNHKKGMWVDPHIMPPWEWRQAKREKKQSVAKASTQRRKSYSSTSTAGSLQQQKQMYASSGTFHGNVKSRKFHRVTCRYYNCKNCTAKFSSREDAISSGYSPCGICRP